MNHTYATALAAIVAAACGGGDPVGHTDSDVGCTDDCLGPVVYSFQIPSLAGPGVSCTQVWTFDRLARVEVKGPEGWPVELRVREQRVEQGAIVRAGDWAQACVLVGQEGLAPGERVEVTEEGVLL